MLTGTLWWLLQGGPTVGGDDRRWCQAVIIVDDSGEGEADPA